MIARCSVDYQGRLAAQGGLRERHRVVRGQEHGHANGVAQQANANHLLQGERQGRQQQVGDDGGA